ncbi:MAG: hypothetical protein K0S56_1064 [Microvirga sp.]|nr:hypothetical protein [Microvirga sp.]
MKRDARDLIGGGVLTAFGLFIAIYSTGNYAFGSVGDMGPGMVPGMLGYLLAALGLIILLPSLWQPRSLPSAELRPYLAISVSIMAFALTIDRFGTVPAIFAVTGVAMLADDKNTFVSYLVVSAILATLAVLIFHLGLGLPIDIINWPF